MHSIYVDVLIFTNIFQDFFLLLVLKRLLHLKASYYRLLFGAIVGGITALVVLLPNIPFWLSLFINLFISCDIILITFGFHSIKAYTKNTASLYILSFLVNGALIFFYLALKPKGMAVINNKVYFNISPLLLIILTIIIYFILWIYKKLFQNHSLDFEITEVNFIYENKDFNVICKIDSGCNVLEPFSQSPVIIVEESEVENIDIDKNKLRIIPFESLGGKGIIYGFKADKVKIHNKILNKDVYIGLCKDIFKGNYKGLVPKNIFED